MVFVVLIKKILFIMDAQIIEKKIMKLEFYGMIKILKIKWPIKKPILSDKDSKNISFKEYCKNFIS